MPLGLAALPIELIDAISKCAPMAGLLSLSRTNRKIYSVCLRWIYHLVMLDTRVRALGCFKSLISNIDAARSVRYLIFHFDESLLLGTFRSMMRTALKNLTSVQVLHLPVSADLVPALSDIHFPRLLHCAIPFSPEIFPFLRLHPTLVHLVVEPVLHVPVGFLPTLEPVCLPDLKTFNGPDIVALSVIPGSRVADITIFWDPRFDTPASTVFEAIASSATDLIALNNVVTSWDASLPAAITKYVPTLSGLSIRNVSLLQTHLTLEDYLTAMDTTIKGLPNLTALCILERNSDAPHTLDSEDLDDEFEIVRRWGDISAALRCCILSSETKWTRSPTDVWYPRNSVDKPADMITRFRWFVSTVIASPALPPAYTAALEFVGGKEMVKIFRAVFEEEGVVPEFELAVVPAGLSMTFPSSPSVVA